MDDQKLQKMVEETMELSKDNNRILHAIQRRSRMAIIVKAIYWLIILAAALGLFYYLQPYIDQVKNFYGGMVDTQHKVADFSGKFSFENLKNYFK